MAAELGRLRSLYRRGQVALTSSHSFVYAVTIDCCKHWLGLVCTGSLPFGARGCALSGEAAAAGSRRRSAGCDNNIEDACRDGSQPPATSREAGPREPSVSTDSPPWPLLLCGRSSLLCSRSPASITPPAVGRQRQWQWQTLQRAAAHGGALQPPPHAADAPRPQDATHQEQPGHRAAPRSRQSRRYLQRRLGHLHDFEQQHGHWMVPLSYRPNGLGRWVNAIRKQYKQGRLPDELFISLEALGFTWDVHEHVWEGKYRELQEFHRQQGHCRVPAHHPENPPLGHWVHRQRVERWRLAPQRREKLDSLGFMWEVFSESWNQKVQQLRLFSARHGHCVVPASYPDQELTTWVYRQRQARRQGQLGDRQVQTLTELGFVWEVHEAAWEEMCNQLEAFHAEQGSTLVPTSGSRLGAWVALQRRLFKSSRLEPNRAQRLEALGFVWDAQQAAWLEKYERLVAFWKQHGHSAVPPQHRLWKWTDYQRVRHRQGRLDGERTALLSALDFPFGHQIGAE